METRIRIDQQESNARGKREVPSTLLVGLRVMVGIIILVLLIRMVSFERIAATFGSSNLTFVGLAFILLTLNLGFQIVKWRYLLSLIDKNTTWKNAIISFLFGISLGSITPGHLGEIPGRAWKLQNALAPQTIGLTLIDKIQILFLFALGGIPTCFFFAFGNIWQSYALTGIAIFLILYVFFNMGKILQLLDRHNFRFFSHRWVEGVIGSISLFRAPHMIVTFLLTSGFYVVLYFQTYFLLNAFSDVSLAKAFAGFAAMMFTKSLVPISLGDLGVREASSVYFFSLVGVPEATAFNAAFCLFLINIFLPGLVGALFLPKFQSFSSFPGSASFSLRDTK